MMSHRVAALSFALLTALGLAGCNASPQPVANASLQAATPADGSPPDFKLPPGAACSAEIDRYSAIVYRDDTTGMVDSSVFDQIKGEIANAADACRAGRDAEARGLIAASQHKHGYPASS